MVRAVTGYVKSTAKLILMKTTLNLYLLSPIVFDCEKNEASKAAHDFVAFILSPNGQAVISKAGTLNLAEGADLKDKW